jgi:hypothetical protein
VAARIAWYRSLWARRVELTNALAVRLADVPGMVPAPKPVEADPLQ